MPSKKKKKKRRNQDLTPVQQLFRRMQAADQTGYPVQKRWPTEGIDWNRFGNIDTENDFRHWINSIVDQDVLERGKTSEKYGAYGETQKALPEWREPSMQPMPPEQGQSLSQPRNVGEYDDIRIMGSGLDPEEAQIRRDWRNWYKKGKQGSEPTRPNY